MTQTANDVEACISDPFADARRADGILVATFGTESIAMILGHRAVREAAKNWQKFSSDAPFRVPIPSEEAVRSVRQLPIEADPPVHSAFRELVKPFFLRPTQPDFIARIDALIATLLDEAMGQVEIEIVRDFALPLQSRALTYLLDMPETEAQTWIGWGTHVFHDGADGATKGSVLDAYIHQTIAAAQVNPGDDFFGAMTRMHVDGRSLTIDEMVGIANLTFAGGRDTIINSISFIIDYFAGHRAALEAICRDPKQVAFAVEEFVRFVSPLTHIGRVCPSATRVESVDVAKNDRISLCWASANFDETVFDDPTTIKLDRSPNPHLGFGSGIHNCLGSAHARTILRSLIRQLGERTSSISIARADRQHEETAEYRRWVGFRSLHARMEHCARDA